MEGLLVGILCEALFGLREDGRVGKSVRLELTKVEEVEGIVAQGLDEVGLTNRSPPSPPTHLL